MSNIRNRKIYNRRMAKTMTHEEKLFFLDHLDLTAYDTIIDFGGADGALLHAVQMECPEAAEKCRFIIVDADPEMVTAYPLKNCERVSNLEGIGADYGKILLVLSSVLHEMRRETVYALSEFCRDHVQTVAMRDMGNYIHYLHNLDNQGCGFVFWLLYSKNFIKPMFRWRKTDIRRFSEMMDTRPIEFSLGVVQYILKCDYKENWEKECAEDYFNNNIFCLADKLKEYGWEKLYDQKYTLPYKAKQAKRRFHIDLPNTHVQMIWNRGDLLI